MDDIYIYFVKFPCETTHEAILPCADGYTLYIDERLSHEQKVEAYRHAVRHIKRNDFIKTDIDEIEYDAHEERI